jgi:citrate synthase
MALTSNSWDTQITNVEPNQIEVRGYPIEDLMGSISFGQAVYLVLKGELPTAEVGKLMEALLISSIDHSVYASSTNAVRVTASTGSSMNAALATGVLNVNKYHGGAVENCMEAIRMGLQFQAEKQMSLEQAAAAVTEAYRTSKKRIAGFGHLIHTRDPRSLRLFELMKEYNLYGNAPDMALAIQQMLEHELKKEMAMNVDGAMAAVLVQLGFESELANAFFIMSRLPGWLAHFQEERTTQKPIRTIDPTKARYTGARKRSL